MTPMVTAAVVIPARNEAERIGAVLRQIPRRLPGVSRVEVVVVDDGSQDRTAEVARRRGAIVARHEVNLGAGAALATGTAAAIRLGADIVVHMDADGQHPPAALRDLVKPLLEGADAASAYRGFGRPMPRLLRIGNRFLSLAAWGMFGVDHPDTQCAYRAFWARHWPLLAWRSRDYSFATEMLVRARRGGLRWAYVRIPTIYLDAFKGTGISDGVRIFGNLLRWRLIG